MHACLKGWEQLENEATLEDVAWINFMRRATADAWDMCLAAIATAKVVDGASILLERSRQGGDSLEQTLRWPFFQRLRLEYKRQNFKDG